MHTTHIGLSLELRQDMINLLNARLADAIDLALQLKMAHWNVRGPHFIGLHKLFDEIVDVTQNHVDDIAERIGQLGGVAHGALQEVVKNSSLPQFGAELSKDMDVLKAIVQGMAAFTNQVRKDIDTATDKGDAVTADLLTDISRETDKYLWFVEAHLQ